jgi:hypothetical protein
MDTNNDRPAHRAIFATKEEAKGTAPEGEHKLRVFELFKGAKSIGFTWANDVGTSLCNLARAEGYTARLAEPKGHGPLTPERAATKVLELSDEELAALGLSRRKAKK